MVLFVYLMNGETWVTWQGSKTFVEHTSQQFILGDIGYCEGIESQVVPFGDAAHDVSFPVHSTHTCTGRGKSLSSTSQLTSHGKTEETTCSLHNVRSHVMHMRTAWSVHLST